MGSMSRSANADRFIKEFNEDFKKGRLRPGDRVKLESISLGQRPGDEMICMYYVFKTAFGSILEVCEDEILFDPEIPGSSENIESIADSLGITTGAAVVRLTKCGLVK